MSGVPESEADNISQASVDRAIQKDVRKWTVYPSSTGGTSVINVLHLDHVDIDLHAPFNPFSTLLQHQPIDNVDKYLQFVHKYLRFHLKPWVVRGERGAWLPGHPPFGAYGRHHEFAGAQSELQLVVEQLKLDYNHITDQFTELNDMAPVFARAGWGMKDFIENIIVLLEHNVTTGGNPLDGYFKTLFTSVCKMAGLTTSNGYDIARSMNVLGVTVSSKPDLRIFRSLTDEWFRTPKTVVSLPERKVIAVVEVKKLQKKASLNASEYNYTFVENMLGELIGKMMAELEYTDNKHKIIGLAVQATKVQVVVLEMPLELKTYCFVEKYLETVYPDSQEHPRGTVHISKPLDFFHPEQRIELLRIVWKLHQI